MYPANMSLYSSCNMTSLITPLVAITAPAMIVSIAYRALEKTNTQSPIIPENFAQLERRASVIKANFEGKLRLINQFLMIWPSKNF